MPSAKVLLSAATACMLGVSGYSYISNSEWFFKRVAMPLVARIDPERAHLAAVYLASKGWVPKDRVKDPAILVRQGIEG